MDFSQLVASLDIHRDGGAVLISPRIQNPAPLTLRYRLVVNQRSAAGTSTIGEEGDIQPGSAPSFVRLSLPAGATCLAHLELYQENALVTAVDQGCD